MNVIQMMNNWWYMSREVSCEEAIEFPIWMWADHTGSYLSWMYDDELDVADTTKSWIRSTQYYSEKSLEEYFDENTKNSE